MLGTDSCFGCQGAAAGAITVPDVRCHNYPHPSAAASALRRTSQKFSKPSSSDGPHGVDSTPQRSKPSMREERGLKARSRRASAGTVCVGPGTKGKRRHTSSISLQQPRSTLSAWGSGSREPHWQRLDVRPLSNAYSHSRHPEDSPTGSGMRENRPVDAL